MLYHTTWLIAELDQNKYIFKKNPFFSKGSQDGKSYYPSKTYSTCRKKVINESDIAKFLTDQVMEDYELVKFDFPYKDHMVILQVKEEFVEGNS